MSLQITLDHLNKISDNNSSLFFILGPCAIENELHSLKVAEYLKKLSEKLNFKLIFKSSFDKANRTSVNGYRSVGLKEGSRILRKIKEELDNKEKLILIRIKSLEKQEKEFNEKYTENQDYNLFVEYTYQHYDIPRNLVKLFGMGVRRFFEGYHQISLPARIKKPRRKIRGRHRTYILQENLIPTKVSVSEKIKNHITNPSDDNFESYLELHRKVKELINLYGMTKVKKIIELEQVE